MATRDMALSGAIARLIERGGRLDEEFRLAVRYIERLQPGLLPYIRDPDGNPGGVLSRETAFSIARDLNLTPEVLQALRDEVTD